MATQKQYKKHLRQATWNYILKAVKSYYILSWIRQDSPCPRHKDNAHVDFLINWSKTGCEVDGGGSSGGREWSWL